MTVKQVQDRAAQKTWTRFVTTTYVNISDTMYSPVAMEGTASREAVTPLLPSFPTLPLSIRTLHSSDFISRPVPRIIYPEGHIEEKFHTPSPVTLPLPSTQTVGQFESLSAFQRHMFSRLPAVKEASRTLQNKFGICNSNDYETPSQPEVLGAGRLVGANPTLKHLMDGFGGPLIKGSSYPNQTEVGTLKVEKEEEIPAPKTSLEMKGDGEKEKGSPGLEPRKAGLRETLLWHGRQPYGQPKRIELASLSFHDITPTINATFNNELIGHFSADPAGTTRIVSYEVNAIPAGPYDEVNPPFPERWISFMITTPVVSIKKDYYLGRGVDCFPPNLPFPIPTSWVIFAAPLSCVDVYLPLRDTIVAAFPAKNPLKTKSQVCDVTRYDYHFSLDGTPVFEFMDKRSTLGDLGVALGKGIHGQFLCSVRDLPGWKEANSRDSNVCDIADLPVQRTQTSMPIFKETRISMDMDDIMAYEGLYLGARPSASPDVEMRGQDVDTEGGARGRVGKYRGPNRHKPFNMDTSQWWTHARVNCWKDSCRWERIKDSMSRGCCRVIATEADSPGPIPGSKYETGFPSGHPLRAKNNFEFGYTPTKCRGVKRKSAFSEEEVFDPERERPSPRRSFDIMGPPTLGGKDFPTPAMTATMSLMDEGEETHHRKRKRSRRSRKSRMDLD